MKLVDAPPRVRVLRKARFGCLNGMYCLNVTRGCAFRCAYCYARGYPDAPIPEEVQLYRDLPEKLLTELENPRRRSAVRAVVFNTASDCFQPHPDVLDVTFRAMEVLLTRGVTVSFLTKGKIPDRFVALFAQRPRQVSARIGLVSLSPGFLHVFEPGTANSSERLSNIKKLREAGIDVEVRVDPIVPFLTDDTASIRSLFAALADAGVERVSLSYLHLRPAILGQLRRELPRRELEILLTCFRLQAWSAAGTSRLVPSRLRERGYAKFGDAAAEFGLKTLICACKNPDLKADTCSTLPQRTAPAGDRNRRTRQLSLPLGGPQRACRSEGRIARSSAVPRPT